MKFSSILHKYTNTLVQHHIRKLLFLAGWLMASLRNPWALPLVMAFFFFFGFQTIEQYNYLGLSSSAMHGRHARWISVLQMVQHVWLQLLAGLGGWTREKMFLVKVRVYINGAWCCWDFLTPPVDDGTGVDRVTFSWSTWTIFLFIVEHLKSFWSILGKCFLE